MKDRGFALRIPGVIRAFFAFFLSFAIYRRLFRLLTLGAVGGLAAVLAANLCVKQAAANRIHEDPELVPPQKAAVVLGCARTLANGRPNLYFLYRIRAAANLYHAGKVEYLVVSGDNHREGYDEPSDMRDALIEAGVPARKIYRDYAGFRTLDSMVRAGEIFDLDSFIVVSQEFHNERAIFIAREHGLDAIGFNATEVSTVGGLRTRLREHLARVKTVLDIWVLDTQPRFLGPKVALGGPVS